MSLYTKLDEANIRQIVRQYNISNIQSWKILVGGVENTNTLICTESENYVLTICERKSLKETKVLVDTLTHLEGQNYETSKLIPTINGNYIGDFQGKPVLLKTYISGEIKSIFENEIIKKLGVKIAQLNDLTPAPNLPHQFSYGQQHFHKVYQQSAHPFANWLKETHAFILSNLHPTLPKAMIHGDVFTSNVVIAKGEDPIIMDFEESCYYYQLFDLGMATVGTCTESGQINWEKSKQLISGYQQHKEFSSKELAQYKNFIVYAATATAFWRFRQFNIIVPMQERKDSYQEMQEFANQAMQKDVLF